MKMSKSKIVKLFIVLVILVLITIVSSCIINYLGENRGDSKEPKKYSYKIVYDDLGAPGSMYRIFIYENYDIKVIEVPGCSTLECLQGNYTPTETEENISFSNEGKEILEIFVKELFANEKDNIIEIEGMFVNDTKLNEEQDRILTSIICNEESLLYELN